MIRKISVVFALVLSMNLTGTAQAGRNVFVNGVRMTNDDLGILEQWHCGPFPDGNYWLNFNNGVWGYAGNAFPQGNISDNCNTRQPSLSERGLLYSPGELLR